MAYQVAFDLFENEYQHFLLNVRDRLPGPQPASSAAPVDENNPETAENGVNTSVNASPDAMDTSEAAQPLPTDVTEANEAAEKPESAEYMDRLTHLKRILSGETPINLTLQFLYSHNRYCCSHRLYSKDLRRST